VHLRMAGFSADAGRVQRRHATALACTRGASSSRCSCAQVGAGLHRPALDTCRVRVWRLAGQPGHPVVGAARRRSAGARGGAGRGWLALRKRSA
jgi:hypothetical protein